MAGTCPRLGLDGNRHQVFLVSSPRHRCYALGRSERIGASFQSDRCLTSAHRHCPRLRLRAAEGVSPAPEAEEALPARDGGLFPEPATRAGELGRFTDLRPILASPGMPARRRLSLGELVVLGLCGSIVLAALFVGYALVYRLRTGPGVGAGPVVLEGSETVTAGAAPTLEVTLAPPESQPEPLTAVPSGPLTPIPEPALPVPSPVTRLAATSPPTRLVIPKIGLDIPVVPVGVKTITEGGKTKTVWADVPNGGGFHQTSAYPGNPGNTVINGHRDILGAVFRHLDVVEAGDEITLYVGEVAYPYLVTEILVVPEAFASAEQRAENLRLIGYMPEERLTLVTCTPVGLAINRLLVIARPPDQVVPDMPEAGSETEP